MKRTKYSAKVREEAALICAVMASTDMNRPEMQSVNDEELQCSLGVSIDGSNLAWLAWEHVAAELDWPENITDPVFDAEAEALLRTGWTP